MMWKNHFTETKMKKKIIILDDFTVMLEASFVQNLVYGN